MPERRSCLSCGASSVAGFMVKLLGWRCRSGIGSVNRRGFVGEEIGGAPDEAGSTGVGRTADRSRSGRQIVPLGEDGLDGAVVRAIVCQGPLAGHLEPLGAVLGLKVQHPLGRPQALGDAVREEPLDQPGTGRPDPGGLLHTPGAVMGEEGPGLRRQVIGMLGAGVLCMRSHNEQRSLGCSLSDCQ